MRREKEKTFWGVAFLLYLMALNIYGIITYEKPPTTSQTNNSVSSSASQQLAVQSEQHKPTPIPTPTTNGYGGSPVQLERHTNIFGS